MKHFKLYETIMLVLIPLAFFIIAISESKLFWFAGTMVILVIAYYVVKFIILKEYKK